MTPGSRLTLLALYLGGAIWLAYEWQRPPVEIGQPVESAPVDIPMIDEPIMPKPSPDTYGAITQRPLFNADRRPQSNLPDGSPETATQQTPAPSTDVSDLRVTAVFMNPGPAIALVALRGRTAQAVRTGDMVGTWKVLDILEDQVILSDRDKRETFSVHEFPKPTAIPRSTTNRPANRRTVVTAPPTSGSVRSSRHATPQLRRMRR